MIAKKFVTVRDFIGFPVRALSLIGFQFYVDEIPKMLSKREKLKLFIQKAFFCLCVSTLALSLASMAAWTFVNSQDPLLRLRGTLNVSNNALLLIRLVVICANRDKLNKLVNILSQIMPSSNGTHDGIKFNENLKRLVRMEVIYGAVCALPLLGIVINFSSSVIRHDIEKLLLDLWLPFDHRNMTNYIITGIYVLWNYYPLGLSVFIVSWLSSSLITLLTLQFDLVGRNLRKILKKPDGQESNQIVRE
jgi:hypothetical protein